MLPMLPVLIGKVRKTVKAHRMLKSGDSVVVAVSGGVDSCVLLNVLNSLKDEVGIDLIVCHLNHNLRGRDSDNDARFVRRLAARFGLPFESRRLSIREVRQRAGQGVQEWARERRLGFLQEVAKKYNARRIAIGHNSGDRAETMLIRLLKGSTIKGLSGMRPVRAPFVRPLIDCSRQEIEDHARANNVKHVEDVSNRSLKYLRNSVRIDLIPYLQKKYNPNILNTLLRTQKSLVIDDQYLSLEAEKVFSNLANKHRGRLEFSRLELLTLHPAMLSRVFVLAAEELGAGTNIYTARIAEFLSVIKGRRPNQTGELCEGLTVVREYDRIVITGGRENIDKTQKKNHGNLEYMLSVPGLTRAPGLGVTFKVSFLARKPRSLKASENNIYLDYDSFVSTNAPVIIRTFRPGDRIRPFGMQGRKKLKDIFIDEKIPLKQRGKIPLLSTGVELLWAVGVKQTELFRISSETKRVLKIQCVKGIA